jgi:hypothetical protein
LTTELHPAETMDDTWAHDAVLPVAVMLASPGRERAADSMLWQVTGIVVGEHFASSERSGVCVRSTAAAELFLWRGFSIRLHPAQAEDYALNLGGDRPEVYVIARFSAEGGMEPLEVTVSLDRAQNLDCTNLRSSEEVVLSAPMPPEIYRWLEAFITTHYEPKRKGKGRGKQRSKAMYDAAVGDFSGDEA